MCSLVAATTILTWCHRRKDFMKDFHEQTKKKVNGSTCIVVVDGHKSTTQDVNWVPGTLDLKSRISKTQHHRGAGWVLTAMLVWWTEEITTGGDR
jgi:hypothetical protein